MHKTGRVSRSCNFVKFLLFILLVLFFLWFNLGSYDVSTTQLRASIKAELQEDHAQRLKPLEPDNSVPRDENGSDQIAYNSASTIEENGIKDDEAHNSASVDEIEENGIKDDEAHNSASVDEVEENGIKDDEAHNSASVDEIEENGIKDDEAHNSASVVEENGNKNGETYNSVSVDEVVEENGSNDDEARNSASVVEENGSKDGEAHNSASVDKENGNKKPEPHSSAPGAENIKDYDVATSESRTTDEMEQLPKNKGGVGETTLNPGSKIASTETNSHHGLCNNYWLLEFIAPRSASTTIMGVLYRQNELQVTGEVGGMVRVMADMYTELFGLKSTKPGSWYECSGIEVASVEKARVAFLKLVQFLFKLLSFPGPGEGLTNNYGGSTIRPPIPKGHVSIAKEYASTPKKVIALKIVRACDDLRVIEFYSEHVFPCGKFIVGGRSDMTGRYKLEDLHGKELWRRCNDNGKTLAALSPTKFYSYTKETGLSNESLTRMMHWVGVNDTCQLGPPPMSNTRGYGFNSDMSRIENTGNCTLDQNKLINGYRGAVDTWTATKDEPFFDVDVSPVNVSTLNQVLVVETPLQHVSHFISLLKPNDQVCLDDNLRKHLRGCSTMEQLNTTYSMSYDSLYSTTERLCFDFDKMLAAWSRNGQFDQPRMHRAVTQLLDFMYPSVDSSCTDREASSSGKLRLAHGRVGSLETMRYAKVIHPSSRFFSLIGESGSPLDEEQLNPFRELGLRLQATGQVVPHYLEVDYRSPKELNELLDFLGVVGCEFVEGFVLNETTKELEGGKLSSSSNCVFVESLVNKVLHFQNIPSSSYKSTDALKYFKMADYYSYPKHDEGRVCVKFG